MNENQAKNKEKVRHPGRSVRLGDLAKKRANNLRDNLAKRKAQGRARTDTGQTDDLKEETVPE